MASDSQGDVTRLLGEFQLGRPGAAEALMSAVYAELHRIADGYMSRERPDHTLQPTALVHEAFLRLVDQATSWQSRCHFFGVAAQAMRRILVDHARHRHRAKRSGGTRVTLDEALAVSQPTSFDVIALDQALTKLAAIDARQGRVVELRFFAGLEIEEIAAALDRSPATVKRDWNFAKAFLQRELDAGAGPEPSAE